MAATRKMIMMRHVDRHDADTWAGVASQALEAVCEGWGKLARVCVFLVFVALAGSCWWWVR